MRRHHDGPRLVDAESHRTGLQGRNQKHGFTVYFTRTGDAGDRQLRIGTRRALRHGSRNSSPFDIQRTAEKFNRTKAVSLLVTCISRVRRRRVSNSSI